MKIIINSFVFGIVILFFTGCGSLGKSEMPSMQEKDKQSLSVLFMITTPKLQFKESGLYGEKKIGPHFILNENSHVIVFSDRPHRVAKSLDGGLVGFTSLYKHSDFVEDPPNATFAGNWAKDSIEKYSVLELSEPFFDKRRVILPVTGAIGDEKLPPFGNYDNASVVVDNIFGAVVGWVEAGAAVVGTAIACGPGEIVSAGTDTALCVAGIAVSAGAITSASCETSDASGKPCP